MIKLENKKETVSSKALPPLLKKTETFILNISQDLQEKIDYICKKIHDVEWSGTLFYTVEGSIEKGDLKIEAIDLFVQDIGTTAFTSFEQSPDVIAYACQHIELLEEGVQMGLVH